MATAIALTTTSPSTRSYQMLNASVVLNFQLVWRDGSIDETNEDRRDSTGKLRQVVNTVNKFIDVEG